MKSRNDTLFIKESNMIQQRVGARGTFSVDAPYDTKIIADAVYVVVDIGLLTSFYKKRENVQDIVYSDVGLDDKKFKEDLDKNIVIVVLEDEAGRQFYIPQYSFKSIAKNNGKYYQHTVLSVEMGAHIVDVDLTVLKAAITLNVQNLFGVTPRVKDFKTSDKRMIPQEDHETIVNRRNLTKTDASNYKLLLDESLERERVAKQTIADLETFILTNCPT